MGCCTDKSADALIEKMEKQWMAMFQQTGAEQEFREKLRKDLWRGTKEVILRRRGVVKD